MPRSQPESESEPEARPSAPPRASTGSAATALALAGTARHALTCIAATLAATSFSRARFPRAVAIAAAAGSLTDSANRSALRDPFQLRDRQACYSTYE